MRNQLRSTAVALPLCSLALLPACTGGSSGGPPPATLPSGSSLEVLLGQRVLLEKPGLNDAVVVDINADGIDDIVEANPFTGTLNLGLGIANDDFVAVDSVDTNGVPVSLAVGDFDGDGDREVAALSLVGASPLSGPPTWVDGGVLGCLRENPARFADATATVAIFDWVELGDPDEGDPRFGFQQDSVDIQLAGYALTIAAGNLGHATDSLLVPSPVTRQVEIYRDTGLGMGLVGALDSLGPSGDTSALTCIVFDVDGDGLNDVLAGEVAYDGVGAGSLAAFVQQADGSFAEPTHDLPSPRVPLLETAGDVDGDGLVDLAVLDLSGETNFIRFLTRGAGGELVDGGGIELPARASTVEVADLDLDGQREVIAGLLDFGELLVAPLALVPNPGEGTEPEFEFERFELGPVPRSLAITTIGADDGYPDVRCGHALGTTLLRVDENGARGAQASMLPEDSHFLRADDLDGDGYVDAVTVDLFQRSIAFLRGLPDGGYEFVGEVLLEPTAQETPGSFVLEDLDGDGDRDIAVAVYASNEVRILVNDGALPFGAPDPDDAIVVGGQPIGVAAGDLDGDGDGDLVVTLTGDRALAVAINGGALASAGGSGFEVLQTLPTGGERPLAIVLHDLDGDGDLDGAFTSGEEDGTQTGFTALIGDGSGTLALGNSVPLPHQSTALVPADLNGDGRVELVANQLGLDATAIQILTTATGLDAFEALTVSIGELDSDALEPASIFVGDADADFDLDLGVLTTTGRPVFLRNEGELVFVESPIFGDLGQSTIPQGVRYAQLIVDEEEQTAELLMLTPGSPTIWWARAHLVED